MACLLALFYVGSMLSAVDGFRISIKEQIGTGDETGELSTISKMQDGWCCAGLATGFKWLSSSRPVVDQWGRPMLSDQNKAMEAVPVSPDGIPLSSSGRPLLLNVSGRIVLPAPSLQNAAFGLPPHGYSWHRCPQHSGTMIYSAFNKDWCNFFGRTPGRCHGHEDIHECAAAAKLEIMGEDPCSGAVEGAVEVDLAHHIGAAAQKAYYDALGLKQLAGALNDQLVAVMSGPNMNPSYKGWRDRFDCMCEEGYHLSVECTGSSKSHRRKFNAFGVAARGCRCEQDEQED